ncbi:MAG: hypothetical protein V4819_18710, partial [Verrucomicrobiota bacterium]
MSSKTLIIGSAAVALGVAAFMATRQAPPDAQKEVSKAEHRPTSRRSVESPSVRLESRPQTAASSLPDDLRRDFEQQAKGYHAAQAGMD